MGRLPKHYPSFFKVLSSPDFAVKLRIPPAFVANFPGEFPASAVIISRTNNGESWGVKIEQIGGTHWFMDDGWQNLVKDNRLEVADFLVFRLISNCVFEVVIYAPTGCEKKLNPERKTDPEQNKQDPFVGRPPRLPKCEDSPHDSRRSRRGVVEAARSGKQRNPSYVVVLKNYHKSSMYFPRAFAEETELARKKSVVLRNNRGQLWPFETRPRPGGGVAIIAGWSAFRKKSKMTVGDTCLFEFIRSAGNVIHVKVIKGETEIKNEAN